MEENKTEEVTEEVTTQEEETKPEARVKIGDMEFGSHEEALTWAEANVNRGSDSEKVFDAYRRGLQEAQSLVGKSGGVTTDPGTDLEQDQIDFEAKFYENPKAALEELKAQAVREAKESISKEQELTRAEQQAWDRFRELNPDLAGKEKVARLMMEEYKSELKQRAEVLGQEEALKFLGQKTRALFQDYAKATLPKEELAEGGASVLSGQGEVVTTGKKEETRLSFADQIRNMNRGRPTGA